MSERGFWNEEILALLNESSSVRVETDNHQFFVNEILVNKQTPTQLFASLHHELPFVCARSNFVFFAGVNHQGYQEEKRGGGGERLEVRHTCVLRNMKSGEVVQLHERKDECVKGEGGAWKIASTRISTVFDNTNMKHLLHHGGAHGAIAHWKKVHESFVSQFTHFTNHEIADKWRALVQSAKEAKGPLTLFEEHTQMMRQETAKFVSCLPITKSDVLVVIDMQNDFLPAADAPDGGKFGVSDGAAASVQCVKLIEKAASVGARIVATRDYHPKDHCSFFAQAGPFPPHCVQGHVGSFLFPPIAAALTEARKSTEVNVIFKGFCNATDSFGGFPYSEKESNDRHLTKMDSASRLHGCSSLEWTGAFQLMCSNSDNDINAPPDVMSVFNRQPCSSLIQGASRVIVCGLALDFCVLDTCVNCVHSRVNPSASVLCVYDAARAAHIPGFGQFGSGFLSNPKFVVDKLHEAGVSLVYTSELTA